MKRLKITFCTETYFTWKWSHAEKATLKCLKQLYHFSVRSFWRELILVRDSFDIELYRCQIILAHFFARLFLKVCSESLNKRNYLSFIINVTHPPPISCLGTEKTKDKPPPLLSYRFLFSNRTMLNFFSRLIKHFLTI